MSSPPLAGYWVGGSVRFFQELALQIIRALAFAGGGGGSGVVGGQGGGGGRLGWYLW